MCAVNSLAVNLCWETADKSKSSACEYLCVSVYSLSITSKLQLTHCTVACSPSGIIHRLVLQGCGTETTNRQDIEKALCCSAESKRTTCRFKKRLRDGQPSPATRWETNNPPQKQSFTGYFTSRAAGCGADLPLDRNGRWRDAEGGMTCHFCFSELLACQWLCRLR